MTDELKNAESFDDESFELSDEALEAVAGGLIYHDAGDAHRKEAFYVLGESGKVIMRRDTLESAQHWAGNLHESTKILTADEFEALRKRYGKC